jgi:hypothetical protein
MDRAIAADVQREHMRLLDKTTAYWYACGYNDWIAGTHRVDPFKFVEHWLVESAKPSHHSIQDTFREWLDTQP